MAQTSTEKLVAALEELKDPKLADIIQRAKEGYYNEYLSPLEFPLIQLVKDLDGQGLKDFARRVIYGEFDATEEEADAWAASSEGQEVFKTLTNPQL